MPHNIRLSLTFALLALLAAACGHPDSFRVSGEIEGSPSMNLRVVYTAPQGTRTVITAAREGKFTFEGASDRPAIVEIFDNEYRLIGRLLAENGRDFHLTVNRDNPYLIKASGNDITEQWAAWLNSRADSLRTASVTARNRIVGAAVRANSSSPLGTILLITEYDSAADPAGAAALWAALSEEARIPSLSAAYSAQLDRVTSAASLKPLAAIPYMVHGGKTVTFRTAATPLSLIAFTDEAESRDSVLASLRRVARHRAKSKLEVIDLSLCPDSVTWHRTVKEDSATWTQGWVAGGISSSALNRLGLPALPYFILTDSAGTQLWRGSSAVEAVSETITRLAR